MDLYTVYVEFYFVDFDLEVFMMSVLEDYGFMVIFMDSRVSFVILEELFCLLLLYE